MRTWVGAILLASSVAAADDTSVRAHARRLTDVPAEPLGTSVGLTLGTTFR